MEKLNDKGSLIFTGLFIYLVATAFINQDVYSFTVRAASLIVFLILVVLALPYIAEDMGNADIDLILMVIVSMLSVIFVFITGSGYGAIFIPTDLAVMSYVTKHLRLKGRDVWIIAFAGALPVALWYSHVRWSYNFNMAGFAFMLMAFFAMIVTELIVPAKDRGDGKAEHSLKGFFEFIIIITAFILSMLYHSRTVMFGIVMFGVVWLFYGVMSTTRVLYDIFLAAVTAGSVLFTGLYVMLAGRFGGVKLLYKDVFSGRQGIWEELWKAFFAHPVTGIGSSYELKSFEIFEVHNGMFDILTVHGIIVFILVVILLWRMMLRAGGYDADLEADGLHNPHGIRRIAVSACFSMMFTSFFENYFTVPPYSVIFMAFVLIATGWYEEDAS